MKELNEKELEQVTGGTANIPDQKLSCFENCMRKLGISNEKTEFECNAQCSDNKQKYM